MKNPFDGKCHTRSKVHKYYIKIYRTLITWDAVWKVLYTELFHQNSPESDIFHLAPAVTHKSLRYFSCFIATSNFYDSSVMKHRYKKETKTVHSDCKEHIKFERLHLPCSSLLSCALRRITTMSEPVSSKHGERMCQQVQMTLFCRQMWIYADCNSHSLWGLSILCVCEVFYVDSLRQVDLLWQKSYHIYKKDS